jgi:pimeloyl-ACP methyl ester carboxylesterase
MDNLGVYLTVKSTKLSIEGNMTPATIPEVTHHRAAVNGTTLHYVAAGAEGSPILLLHGWPETWWAFHKVIPHLARSHRVFAVDLRGFGASDIAQPGDSSATMAEDLCALIGHIGLGPVHLVAQDFSGPLAFRLASTYPQDVQSFIAIETGLPGFGLEILANPAIAWYWGTLAKPGAAECFFKGRETALLNEFIFASLTAIEAADIAEFSSGYARAGGWNGAQAIYASNLGEVEDYKAMVAAKPLAKSVLAIDQAGSDFTARSLGAAIAGELKTHSIPGTGHYIAMEAPIALAAAIMDFIGEVDRGNAEDLDRPLSSTGQVVDR